MRYYLYLILTLIFAALVGIGYLLFKSYQLNNSLLKNNLVRMVDETSDKVFVANTKDTILVESNGDREPMGTVAGEICYPSQSIPPLQIYFDNVETDERVTLETELNQDTYEQDLIPGTYVAYAYVKDMEDSSGGYTEAVPCGLTADCEDHKLIEFKIVDDGLTSDIDICDWYGAEIPEQ